MRGLTFNDREGLRRIPFFIVSLVAVLPLAASAESLSLGEALVVPAPGGFSYSITEVRFLEPRNISVGAGVIRRLEAVKVVVKGEGFRPKATGPILWLNGIPTLRTQVAEDGRMVEAYFFESFQTFEEAAARLGRWELIYQPHEGAREVYRISPTGDPALAAERPGIRLQIE